MNNLVVFERKDLAIAASPQIKERVELVLADAALVGRVVDASTNEVAVVALQSITTLANEIERARKVVKEPVLDLGRAIDAEAKRLTADLLTEKQRIAQASADWQTEQLERVRAQERARQAELDRIDEEQRLAQQKIEDDLRRTVVEANRKLRDALAAAKSEEDCIAAEARAKAERERIDADAESARKRSEELAIQDAQTLGPAPALVKAAGQSVKEKWSFEVIQPFDLFRARPDLVNLVPRTAEINQAIEHLAMSGTPKIAGLRIFREVQVSTRATTGRTVDV